MEKWIFTFGCGSPLKGKCQPIFAESYERAREIMFNIYGDKWCFQYSDEEWKQAEADPYRCYKLETEMVPIYDGQAVL